MFDYILYCSGTPTMGAVFVRDLCLKLADFTGESAQDLETEWFQTGKLARGDYEVISSKYKD